jgi:ABC-type glutathione transport system ATPase component
MDSLLKIDKLTIKTKEKTIVNNFNFEIKAGETAAFVGRSGCGKSTVAKSVLKMLEPDLKVVTGSILYKNKNILSYGSTKTKTLRGCEIGYIYQSPTSAFNPLERVLTQIDQTCKSHKKVFSKKQLVEKCLNIMSKLGFKEDEGKRILNSYPHQLSGGQAARAYTTLVSVLQPKLIFADESFAELDYENKINMANYFKELVESGASVVVISHNKELVENFTDNIFPFTR